MSFAPRARERESAAPCARERAREREGERSGEEEARDWTEGEPAGLCLLALSSRGSVFSLFSFFFFFFVFSSSSPLEDGLSAESFWFLSFLTDVHVMSFLLSFVLSFFPSFSSYTDKARELVFNLKKNRTLAASVMLGNVTGAEVVSMSSQELATSEALEKTAKMLEEANNERRLDFAEYNSDKIDEFLGIEAKTAANSLFTCIRCRSVKTSSTQKQTRSADEPMTITVTCHACGKRWRAGE